MGDVRVGSHGPLPGVAPGMGSKLRKVEPQAPSPEELQRRAQQALKELEDLATQAIAAEVERLARKLVARGLVTESGRGVYLPAPSVPTRYDAVRAKPAELRRQTGFASRSVLNRPRKTGSKAFRAGGDARTLVAPVTGGAAGLWSGNLLFRGALNGATTPTGSGCPAPAGALEALGVTGAVVTGCTLLDSLDQFNTFLDTVREQDRSKVEIVVFYRHFREYLHHREPGKPPAPGPEVVYGFRRCQAALSRCTLFDKEARQAWKRCCAATVRDTGLSSIGALLGAAGMGLKVHSGADLAACGLSAAGTALAGAGVVLTLACAGIDISVGLGELSFRKQEYRRCKASCRQIRQLIEQLRKGCPVDVAGDRGILIDVLEAALKQQRRLMQQARYEKGFARVRIGRGVCNAVGSTPLATAAVVTGAVGTAALAWPLAVTAAAFSTLVGAVYLGTYCVKAGTREELRSKARRGQYDATTLAGTTPAGDRSKTFADTGRVSVAGTQGYWTGGRDGFAGGYVRKIELRRHAHVSLDQFADLLSRRPTDGHLDPVIEAAIQAFLALSSIDAALLADIEAMVRANACEMRRRGASERDIEWAELVARRAEYATAFGLASMPPKLPPGALLPSFQAACWIARLHKRADPQARKFAVLLDRHLKGEQIDLHGMNEWLQQNGYFRDARALTNEEMWAAADRLFRSVPPTLFMDHMQALLASVAAETRDRDAFQWQEGSLVRDDLDAFCRFADRHWNGGRQAILAVHGVLGKPVEGNAVRIHRHFLTSRKVCTDEDLWLAIQYLASGCALPDQVAPQTDREELERVLREEWTRRFGGAGDRPPAAFLRHPSIRRRFPRQTWHRAANGDFHCDPGHGTLAVVRADALRRWVARCDWGQPVPVERRSGAPAAALRWLVDEPGSGVDAAFIRSAGAAASLRELSQGFERSHGLEGTVLHDRLISRDNIAEGTPWLEQKLGSGCRVVLTDVPMSAGSPWLLLERTRSSGASPPWRCAQDPGESHATLASALQAFCTEHGKETVRVVLLAKGA